MIFSLSLGANCITAKNVIVVVFSKKCHLDYPGSLAILNPTTVLIRREHIPALDVVSCALPVQLLYNVLYNVSDNLADA